MSRERGGQPWPAFTDSPDEDFEDLPSSKQKLWSFTNLGFRILCHFLASKDL